MDNSAPKQNPQDYFVTDIDSVNPQEESFSEKIKPVQDTAQKGMIHIWPTVTRAINTVLYYSLKIIRSVINIAVSQLK